MSRKARLSVVQLEDRSTPATFGAAWADPTHLTISLPADGTAIAGHGTTLTRALGSQFRQSVWQREMLRALQTWAVTTNISVGIVADGGQPFGTPGASQADSRFGDIRVGGQPMDLGVLAVSVPHDPFFGGTLAGDVFVNTSHNFAQTQTDLYSVFLHEFGHVFGLDNSLDPASAMYGTGTMPHTGLSAGDVAAIKALYGSRMPDAHDADEANGTIGSATDLDTRDGTFPAVTFGDITTLGDMDVYEVRAPSGYYGPMTVRLQTAGISLLAPKVTVLTQSGQVVGTAQSSNFRGDAVTVRVASVNHDNRLYIRVQGATSDVFGIGRYALAVTLDNANTMPASTLESILRGPYDTLSESDLKYLLEDPTGTLIDDSLSDLPVELEAPDDVALPYYRALGSLSAAADVDLYRFEAAEAPTGTPNVATLTVAALGPNGTAPRVALYDSLMQPVPGTVLANGNGTYTIQATGLQSEATYHARVFAPSSATSPGNYALSVSFGRQAAALTTFSSGAFPQLATGRPAIVKNTLFVNQVQLFQFLLSTEAGGAAATVRMRIMTQTGETVYSLSAPAGAPVSGPAVLLEPGRYRVLFTAQAAPGVVVRFALKGAVISDPIGPAQNDLTLAPIYSADDIKYSKLIRRAKYFWAQVALGW